MEMDLWFREEIIGSLLPCLVVRLFSFDRTFFFWSLLAGAWRYAGSFKGRLQDLGSCFWLSFSAVWGLVPWNVTLWPLSLTEVC